MGAYRVHRFIWLGLLIGMASCSALKKAVEGEDETTEDQTDGTADEGAADEGEVDNTDHYIRLVYTSPSPRDRG